MLAGMSMLKPQIEREIHQTVLPWLQNQKDAFTSDKQDSISMSEKLIEKGILKRMNGHAKTLKARANLKKRELED